MNHELLTATLSLAGRKHRDKGLPCEDSSCSVTKNDVSVICLSDGAGASQYTHAELGAKCVVQTICDLMVRHFDAFFFDVRESVVRSIIVAAVQSELTILAQENSLPGMDCMSATMLFCAVKDSRVIFGHIGDGIIAEVTGSGIQMVTMPQNGEDASSTFFITLPNAQDYLRIIRTTTDDAHAYILMTDGLSDLVYDHSKMLIMPVVARLAELACLPTGEKELQLSQTIRSYIIDISPLSDDASIGILYQTGTKIPDMDRIPSNKEYCLRDTNDEMKAVQLEILPRVRKAKEIVTQGITINKDKEKAEENVSVQTTSTENLHENEPQNTINPEPKTIGSLVFLFVGFGVALIFFLIGALIFKYI